MGFRKDELGDWVADLECFHGQHVRHRPPFQVRPWVQSEDERSNRIGSLLNCPLCDRCEVPEGLVPKRVSGPWTRETFPVEFQRENKVAGGAWARINVFRGEVKFSLQVVPPLVRVLRSNGSLHIPPGISHRMELSDDAQVELEFLERVDGP